MFLTSNQTQLSSIDPNNSHILTSNTITEKYLLVRDFLNFFYRVYSSPPGFLSQPWHNLYILIYSYIFKSCRILIPNNWKWTSIWMRFLQNLLKIVIRGCFQKFILELETFSNIKAVDFTLENVQYFNLLIPCLYTLNPLSLLMNWVTTFDKATYRTMESRESCKTTYMIRIKESDERSLFKKF